MGYLGPFREVTKAKQGNCIGVDGYDQGYNTDQIHDKASLHHVNGLHAAVTEDDGIRCSGHGQGEGVGTDDAWRRMYSSFQGHLLGGSGRWG